MNKFTTNEMSALNVFSQCGSKERYTDMVKLWKKRKETSNNKILLEYLNTELIQLHFMTITERKILIKWVIKQCQYWYDDHVSFAKNFLNVEPLA